MMENSKLRKWCICFSAFFLVFLWMGCDKYAQIKDDNYVQALIETGVTYHGESLTYFKPRKVAANYTLHYNHLNDWKNSTDNLGNERILADNNIVYQEGETLNISSGYANALISKSENEMKIGGAKYGKGVHFEYHTYTNKLEKVLSRKMYQDSRKKNGYVCEMVCSIQKSDQSPIFKIIQSYYKQRMEQGYMQERVYNELYADRHKALIIAAKTDTDDDWGILQVNPVD